MTSTPIAFPPLSADGLLQSHAASQDPKLAALEQAITERISLKSKNEQLWKLIEKQRAGYNQLIQELERMRSERDAYKTKLVTLANSDDRKRSGAGQPVAAEVSDAAADLESPTTPRPSRT
jgi:RalA-binding protein 1